MEADIGNDFSIKDLKSNIESMMKMLNTLTSNREDDNILLQTMTSQVQLQGHRIKQIEGHVKDHLPIKGSSGDIGSTLDKLSQQSDGIVLKISELKNAKGELSSDDTSEFDILSSHIESKLDQFTHLSEKMMSKVDKLSNVKEQLEKTDSSKMESLLSNFDNKLDQFANSSEQMMSKMDDQADRVVQLESAILHLSDKVERMTTITAYSNTKLKEEAITIKHVVRESEAGLKQEMTKQTHQVLKDNREITKKCDKIIEMSTTGQSKATHIKDSLDSLKDAVKNQNKAIEKVHKEFTRTGKMQEIMQKQSGAVIDQSIMGVEIETIKSGDGKTFAQKGQTVVVHYTGTLLDGTQFGSTRDEGKPFETKIGVGQVIAGWDEGFTKLSLGQRAKLTITPDMGYGATAAGKDIPPNATLIFDVELLGIK